MHRVLLAVLLAILFGSPSGILTVTAAEEIQEQPVEYVYNDRITFQSIFTSDSPVELAVIFFQAKDDSQTFVELAAVQKLSGGRYQIQHTHPAGKHHFQAFTTIEYRYEILLQGGETFKSPQYSFQYTDNRFEWETLQEGPFIVYWFNGDYAFAQSILDVAQEGLDKITGILPVPEPDLLHIYAYPDSKLMQEALNPTGENWVAGHALPDSQTMILFLPPNPDHILDVRQRVPHETMHILLSQMTGSGYARLPFWLAEGLASLVELYPNPDYPILLDNAYDRNGLIPIGSLCDNFPRDASGALLAYAQSASFTNFLYKNFGTDGLQRLIAGYSNGMDCENGVKSALGSGLVQLERRWWRESLSGNPAVSALFRMVPWLTILLLVFLAPVFFMIASWKANKGRKVKTPPEQSPVVNSAGNSEDQNVG